MPRDNFDVFAAIEFHPDNQHLPDPDDLDQWTDAQYDEYADLGRKLLAANPHLRPTPDCPPFALFLPEFRPADFDERFGSHFAGGCAYCARRLRKLPTDAVAGTSAELAAGLLPPVSPPVGPPKNRRRPWRAARHLPRGFLLAALAVGFTLATGHCPAPLSAAPACEAATKLEEAPPPRLMDEDVPPLIAWNIDPPRPWQPSYPHAFPPQARSVALSGHGVPAAVSGRGLPSTYPRLPRQYVPSPLSPAAQSVVRSILAGMR